MHSSLTSVQNIQKQFWPGEGEHGIVPVHSIVPSPYNPRKHFDEGELDLLADTIRNGGQREIITVRLLTEDEKLQYPGVRYMLTSGERRWRAAQKAGLECVEIRVRGYASRAAEKKDAYMLNEGRVGLSDLEHAWAIKDLAEEHGWETQAEIAREIGREQVWVSQTMALLRCSEKVRARMHPRLKPDDRLSKQVGVYFSKLQPDLQDRLIAEMPSDLLTAVSQVNWLKKKVDEEGVELPTRETKPSGMRLAFARLADMVNTKSTMMRTAQELSRLFENTPEVEAEDLAVKMRNALIEFEKLVECVEKLSEMPGKQTMLVPRPHQSKAQDFLEKRTPPVPARVATIAPVAPKSAQAHVLSCPTPSTRPSLTPQSSPTVVPSSNPARGADVTVSRWHEGSGRYVLDKVDLRTYCRLWDENMLEFQREKKPRPYNYPDRNHIVGL